MKKILNSLHQYKSTKRKYKRMNDNKIHYIIAKKLKAEESGGCRYIPLLGIQYKIIKLYKLNNNSKIYFAFEIKKLLPKVVGLIFQNMQ